MRFAIDRFSIGSEKEVSADDFDGQRYIPGRQSRFYDFYLPDYRILLELDGDYYHAYGKVYEEMSPMQKRNARVDKIKDDWAIEHGIPLIRIWEHDINENPQKVMKMLEERLDIALEKRKIEENKRKRH